MKSPAGYRRPGVYAWTELPADPDLLNHLFMVAPVRDPGGPAMVVDMHVVMSMGIHDHCIRLRGYDSRANHCQPEGRRQKNFLHEYPQFGTNAHQPDRARTVPSSREVQADV